MVRRESFESREHAADGIRVVCSVVGIVGGMDMGGDLVLSLFEWVFVFVLFWCDLLVSVNVTGYHWILGFHGFD